LTITGFSKPGDDALFRRALVPSCHRRREITMGSAALDDVARRTMTSLRFRLLGCVVLALILSLGFGGAIACWNASRLAQTEMRTVLALGEQKVRHALGDLSRSDNRRQYLEHLITAFNGDRYLRATLLRVGDDSGRSRELIATSTLDEPLYRVPEWFLELLGLTPETMRIPIAIDNLQGFVALETDPSNEAQEIWDGFGDGLLVVAMFCGLTILLVGWFAGRAVVEPLKRVSSALYGISGGDYGRRVTETGPSELAGLAASFNRMADRLSGMEARNRGLNEQLLTLQEEERAALARDLHDEIGPYLFAINVDAATIARLAEDKQVPEIPLHVKLIHEGVAHMQEQVKATLGRLRPAGLTEFGLKQVIEHLIAFWRYRHPKIEFEVSVTIEPQESGFGELIDATLYRVIQEGVSNAVRHGEATRITIMVAPHEAGRDIIASITDNGRGLTTTRGSSDIGFGLLGMRERVAALGGSLTIADRSDSGDRRGGLAVVARLPRPI
jgi:two-component system sensor histidine kinase UhpB